MSFADKLKKKVEMLNKRQQDNFEMYAEECKRQGKKVGEPIDIMEMTQLMCVFSGEQKCPQPNCTSECPEFPEGGGS